MKKCSVANCERKHYAKGYCKNHWTLNRRWGTPTPVHARNRDKTCALCNEPVEARDLCKAHYSAWWIEQRIGQGEASTEHYNHKDDVGYYGAHARVRCKYGRASNYACVDCGRKAKEWSLSADADIHVQQTGRMAGAAYSPNPDDYSPRCQACHRTYDVVNGTIRADAYQRTEPRLPNGTNDGECSFDGCSHDAKCKGLCWGHYGQRRAGRELTPLRRYAA